MNSSGILLAVPLAATVACCAATSGYLWVTTDGDPTESALTAANYAQALVLVAIAVVAAGQVVAVLSDTIGGVLVGNYVTLVAGVWLAPLWLVFALYYTGRTDLVTARTFAPVVGVGLAISVATATGRLHGHVFADLAVLDASTTPAESIDFGVVAWASTAYVVVVASTAGRFLFEKFLNSRNVYRKISFLHLVGGVVLGGAPVLAGLGWSPTPYVALGPVAFFVIIAVSAPSVVTYRYLKLLPLDGVLALVGGRFRRLTPMARDTIVEQMDTGVVVVDHDNRIVDINPLGRKMLAADGRRVVGKRVPDVIPPSLFETDDTSFLEPTARDREYRGVWTGAEADAQRCFDIKLSVLGSPDDPAGRVALVDDVTDRELRKEKLEQRTMELERQNEQLERFAGVVSHDLRNPLNVAQGYLDAAREVEDDDAMLAEAEESLGRMAAIIDDVLTLAREGKSIGATERVALEDVARDAWENVDTADATLSVDADAAFDADRARLLNLFENLFRNSAEHGDVGVTVTVDWTDDGFVVADDGPGIPEDERDEVLSYGYTTADAGTGFGLAIVEQVADAHGWTVDVGASPSGGAQFTFGGVADERAASRPGVVTD